jgi:stage II sporulation protein R
MKTIEKALAISLCLGSLLRFMRFWGTCRNISDKTFRLHILANSDSNEDQNLKLKVRDRILEYTREKFSYAEDKISAKRIAEENLDEIKHIAKCEISDQGYNYNVKTELVDKMYFNTRQYGNFTLPAGNYDALRVSIGDAKGKNWFCFMYPGLCIPAAIDRENIKKENKKRKELNSSEIKVIEGELKYEIKFKVVEWLENLKNYLRK